MDYSGIVRTGPLIAVTSPWFSTSPTVPQPPKRYRTLWQVYFTEHWPTVVKENPGSSKSDLFKKLSENWKKLDKSLLEKYQKISDESRKKYLEEKEIYSASLTSADKLAIAQHKASVKRVKDKTKSAHKKELRALGMPKRPASAYILFSVDYVKKHHEQGFFPAKVASKISAAWAQLSEEEKSKWNEIAAAEKIKYKENLEEWRNKMIAEGNLVLLETKAKAKSKTKSE
ncbi:Transcription factor A, mitochondrial [Frankliniella fusca]|uniref:Transcription factor A, mitochondrial n=1 Tax=Frankliniella fusca TaxID=407009 RepID=A0AAE1H881_9NEOP|nr:Transcription factor A, mitochondrial [Frankliniella fusca]